MCLSLSLTFAIGSWLGFFKLSLSIPDLKTHPRFCPVKFVGGQMVLDQKMLNQSHKRFIRYYH